MNVTRWNSASSYVPVASSLFVEECSRRQIVSRSDKQDIFFLSTEFYINIVADCGKSKEPLTREIAGKYSKTFLFDLASKGSTGTKLRKSEGVRDSSASFP